MKTLTSPLKTLLIFLSFCLPIVTSAQNLVNNPYFEEKGNFWDSKEMPVDINLETAYGGKDESNLMAEIDAEAGLRQQIELKSNQEYFLYFGAGRRISKETPDDPGITVRLIGIESGYIYLQEDIIFKNTEFSLSDQKISFAIPSDAKDKGFFIQFSSFNNKTTFGVIIDNIQLSAFGSLPVELVNFTGEIVNGQALLKWQTAKEKNNKYFVIERSVDGRIFDSIGVVYAAPSVHASNNYAFTDSRKVNGAYYYRLGQTDIDGRRSSSKTVLVKGQISSMVGIKAFPTSANAVLFVSVAATAETKATISIVDISGRMMMQTDKHLATGINRLTVDISTLRNGIYFLNVTHRDDNTNSTLTFQKIN